MDPERWRQIGQIFDAAMNLPPDQRVEFLAGTCTDDQLRQEVGQLMDVAEHGPSFSPGELVADRFRIVRKLGEGGMGVVYEATDESLDRRVALKCGKPGRARHLPPEARAAREVSHHNVCKVHDLHVASTPAGDLEFLSMEFVEGPTLSSRIKDAGPLKEPEAREIARQICAGLEQAHRQGVIHADLKCANVLLATAKDGGVRAVITDFGLAKFAYPDGSSIASARGGTPDYMAPELLLGEHATVASDIYALGVLFHVMLTGHVPQRLGDTQLSMASQPIMRRSPAADGPTPSTFTMGPIIADAHWRRKIDDLPRPWKRIVVRCLAPQPQHRFTAVAQIQRALEPNRAVLKWSAAAILTAALSLGYWEQQREPPSGPPVRLAVLPFTADAATRADVADVAGVALDVADRLSGLRRNFAVISPREVQQNQVDTPEKAKSILGATHILQTRLSNPNGQVHAEVSLIDVSTGQSLASLNGDYRLRDTVTLAKALVATVTGAFRLRPATKESVSDVAYPDYIHGMNLLDADPLAAAAAIPYFERAVAIDSKSALPYAALAQAQLQRFANRDGSQWLDMAETNVQKARSINPDSARVLLVAGEVDRQHGRYEQAIRAFTRATELDPNEPRAWTRLAQTYEQSNQDAEAVATYQKAVASQPNSYTAYLNFGNFYLSRAEFRQAEDMYRKMTAVVPSLASGHMNLGLALEQQGRFPEAEQELLKALSLRESPRLLMNIGALYYEEEQFEKALSYFLKSQQAGTSSVVLYRNLGDAYRHLGRATEAASAYRSGRALSEEEVARNPRDALSHAHVALLSGFLGATQQAKYELSQALSEEPGNTRVMREAVITYEVLKQTDRAIALLQSAPRYLIEELNRQPDVRALRKDARFQQLLKK